MLTFLSPAKNLDFSPYHRKPVPTIPAFAEESDVLMKVLKKLKPKQISKLMSLSENLAQLNFQRYQEWDRDALVKSGKPALFAFNGDVYRGLDAASFSDDDVAFAQDHLMMLSGLHGVLRPLDRILPYRLEMGSGLNVSTRIPNLYAFWGEKIGKRVEALLENHREKVVVNLASSEYSKALLNHSFKIPVITCQFLDLKKGKFQAVQTWTKLARGAMAGLIVKNRMDDPDQLRSVAFNGYTFDEALSSEHDLVFTRKKLP